MKADNDVTLTLTVSQLARSQLWKAMPSSLRAMR